VSILGVNNAYGPTMSNPELGFLPGKCKLLPLKNASDSRGDLTAIDFSDFHSFDTKRVFYVHKVPSFNVRGEHAHKNCSQFLIALNGSLRISLDDGFFRAEVFLNNSSQGLLIPPMVWAAQYQFVENTVLAVLASDRHDANDYIRNY
jgi:UDP-2-acetamido-3-amino-2,3-dideoxy-glucuronate N-acetyltransferase